MKTRKWKNRQGRCYEISVIFMMDNADLEPTLVHGLAYGAGDMNPHAWVELSDGTIYEPVGDRIFPGAYAYPGIAQKRYSVAEMSDWIAETEHYGPWEVTA